MDINKTLKQAKDSADMAVKLDRSQKFEESIKYYIDAANKLNILYKNDQNIYNKDSYKKRAVEYIERAKKLKGLKSGGTSYISCGNNKGYDEIDQLGNEIKEIANKAIEYEKQENYQEAYDYYVKAATKLKFLIKIDKNQSDQEMYKKRAKEYCERAKLISKTLIKKPEMEMETDNPVNMNDLINHLRNEAKDFATKAIELEKIKKFEDAYYYYTKASIKLNYLIKIDKNTNNKVIYENKAKEYDEKAKLINGYK